MDYSIGEKRINLKNPVINSGKGRRYVRDTFAVPNDGMITTNTLYLWIAAYYLSPNASRMSGSIISLQPTGLGWMPSGTYSSKVALFSLSSFIQFG